MLACISGAKSINIHDGLRKACKLFIKLFSTVRATGISATFEYHKWPFIYKTNEIGMYSNDILIR